MTPIINNYKKVKQSIPKLLDLSGFRNDYIAKKIGMKPAYFSVKKQRGNWTEDEIEIILTAISSPSQDVEDYLMLLEMEASEKETGLPYAEFKKLMKWK